MALREVLIKEKGYWFSTRYTISLGNTCTKNGNVQSGDMAGYELTQAVYLTSLALAGSTIRKDILLLQETSTSLPT